MEIFPYGQAEIEHLKSRDERLGAAMDAIGMIEREVTPDLLTALLKGIVSQQISRKAAATVWQRLCDRLGEVTPERIVQADVADIQQSGLSMRKAGYIKGIGEAALRGDLQREAFDGMPDDQVIAKLSALRGIGVWSAEMLLIFSLCRPDVVSWGDLAIRRGMMRLYGLEELTRAQFDVYRERYAPFGSVASLYLWALSH